MFDGLTSINIDWVVNKQNALHSCVIIEYVKSVFIQFGNLSMISPDMQSSPRMPVI